MRARVAIGAAAGLIALAAPAVVLLAREDGASRAAARPAARPVVTSACSPVTYAGEGRPSAIVVVTAALQGAFQDHGLQTVQAVKLALAEHGWRAGPHTVGVQVCGEVPFGSDDSDAARCKAIGRAVAPNRSVIAVIGLWSSTCAPMLEILNRAPGPVVVVSPSATYLGLTRAGAGVRAGDPQRFRSSGRRNFARVVPADDAQAAAGVAYLRQVGTRRVFVLDDGGPYGVGLAAGVREAARTVGIAVAGSAQWRPSAERYTALAQRIRRARADGVYLAGFVDNHGPRLIKDLRATRATLIAPDGFADPGYVVERIGAAGEDFVYTFPALPSDHLPPAGRRFATDFRQRFGDLPCCYAVQNAQAMDVILDALAASDGTRADVTRRVLGANVRGGLLGSFRFDEAGDTTNTTFGVYRIVKGAGRFRTSVAPPVSMLPGRS